MERLTLQPKTTFERPSSSSMRWSFTPDSSEEKKDLSYLKKLEEASENVKHYI